MEKISDFNDTPIYNRIYVNPAKSSLRDSKVVFQGNNNILFVENGVAIAKSEIIFKSSNSIIYLSKSDYVMCLSLAVGQDCTIFIGRNCYFNDQVRTNLLAAEWQNIIIGNDGAFSFGLWFRTTDAHLIYDIGSKERTNYSKPILIGDHVWIGQNSSILKGTYIGSGAVIGGGSVVSNKRVASNTIYAGNPAKQVRSGIFWSGPCTYTWAAVDTQKQSVLPNAIADMWTYTKSPDNQNLEEISRTLQEQDSANDRLSLIMKTLVSNQAKNRFYLDNC